MLYVARIIAGFAGGICSVVCPCYLGTYLQLRLLIRYLKVDTTIRAIK